MSVDLRTRYLGLELQHPIVASASPLTGSLDSLKRLQAAGVAAVVLPSLFEEQIEHEEMATARPDAVTAPSCRRRRTASSPRCSTTAPGPTST